MTDGDQGSSSIAWRRKLLSSAVSGKSSSKAKGLTASSSTPTKPTADRSLSSSPSFSDLGSLANARADGSRIPSQTDAGDERAALPRRNSSFTNPSTNAPWSPRARTDSIREEDEGERATSQMTDRSNGTGVRGGSVRAAVEMIDAERLRKMNASRKSPQPKVSSQDSTDGNSGDEDGEKEGRRGSVIGKVAHRAKLSLPLRRTRDHYTTERPDSPAAKSSVSGSSQSTQRNESANQAAKSAAAQADENRNLPGSPFVPTATNKHKMLPSPLATRNVDELALLDTAAGAMKEGAQDSLSPTRVMTPSNITPRVALNSPITAGQDTQIPRSGVVKRSNKILDLATTDLNDTGPAVERASKPLHLNSLNTVASKRQPSMNSIKEGVEEPTNTATTTTTATPTPTSTPTETQSTAPNRSSQNTNSGLSAEKPATQRSTSAMKVNSISNTSASNSTVATKVLQSPKPHRERKPPTFEPPMPEVEDENEAQPAPSSGMYWSKAPCFGYDRNALRAHTATLVGSNIYVFGGCDSQACFNDLYVFDADCMYWTNPECSGEIPPSLRAMTATAVGKKIVIIGGGDGPAYYNDVYVLDTLNRRYTKPKIQGTLPSNRRAHTACLYKHGIYVFGGGDGEKALNDIWRLDVSDTNKPSWRLISPPSKSRNRPTARGYHTANMVGSKLIIFGGSDGVECFRDVWVYDVDTNVWKPVKIDVSFPRLSHTSTVVGSYMFVIGGHDGVEYSSDVLLLNLVTMQWDKRKVYGHGPSGRGYHTTVLHDSRLFVIGGFDGTTVFDDTFILELAINAYYPQISHFTVDV